MPIENGAGDASVAAGAATAPGDACVGPPSTEGSHFCVVRGTPGTACVFGTSVSPAAAIVGATIASGAATRVAATSDGATACGLALPENSGAAAVVGTGALATASTVTCASAS